MIIDPSSYSNRDLLLFTQLLHTKGYIEPKSVENNDSSLDDISTEWFHHTSTQLSIQDGLPIDKPWSRQQCYQLYQNLLKLNPDCENTTDLANHYYYTRINELTSKIDQYKLTFPNLE
ncbi:hypothetical protein HYPBUDRAFT_110399 [Hyphopichia burtonii NRRL Y-1933]|uniref:Uncharacterized protein n=1 Tax=Hyphopichia burtonii NRRL Y-1933 TaxID=984485 RepID=A0A1E4RJC5_9ASCO|nr:hypothetical protein HYPBUDRAFT_110399 [Hyphopichia burtonii NRRL Y-1933]ODV67336.1 hypothetical protein HYPBUDRAFT_110399 [Hyphopichia burtonii NRRL Y-1933]